MAVISYSAYRYLISVTQKLAVYHVNKLTKSFVHMNILVFKLLTYWLHAERKTYDFEASALIISYALRSTNSWCVTLPSCILCKTLTIAKSDILCAVKRQFSHVS